MSETLYIVIPAYNEEESIENVLDQWYPFVENADDGELIVVDDGSKDSTAAIAKKYAESHPRLVVIQKENQGHGAAIYDGYSYAIDKFKNSPQSENKTWVFQTDSDGQTSPEDFQQVWKLRNSHDVVMGNRTHREDGPSRVFVTNVLGKTIKAIFGVSIEDANVPFRLMSAEVLSEDIKKVPERFNLTNVALSVAFAKQNRNMVFTPIRFGKRETGVNSINMRHITSIGINAIKDFWRIRKEWGK